MGLTKKQAELIAKLSIDSSEKFGFPLPKKSKKVKIK